MGIAQLPGTELRRRPKTASSGSSASPRESPVGESVAPSRLLKGRLGACVPLPSGSSWFVLAPPRRCRRPGSSSPVVVIDPGHDLRANPATEPIGPGSSTRKIKDGGGTHGLYRGSREAELNLRVALRLRPLLERAGVRVVMTQDEDGRHEHRQRRARRIANRAGPRSSSASTRTARPTRAHAARTRSTPPCASATTTSTPRASVPRRSCSRISLRSLGFPDRGLQERTDFTGFNWADVPVILVEMGFMTNPTEDRLLDDAVISAPSGARALPGGGWPPSRPPSGPMRGRIAPLCAVLLLPLRVRPCGAKSGRSGAASGTAASRDQADGRVHDRHADLHAERERDGSGGDVAPKGIRREHLLRPGAARNGHRSRGPFRTTTSAAVRARPRSRTRGARERRRRSGKPTLRAGTGGRWRGSARAAEDREAPAPRARQCPRAREAAQRRPIAIATATAAAPATRRRRPSGRGGSPGATPVTQSATASEPEERVHHEDHGEGRRDRRHGRPRYSRACDRNLDGLSPTRRHERVRCDAGGIRAGEG